MKLQIFQEAATGEQEPLSFKRNIELLCMLCLKTYSPWEPLAQSRIISLWRWTLLLHTLMHQFSFLAESWCRLFPYTHTPPVMSKSYSHTPIGARYGETSTHGSTGANRLCPKSPEWAQSQLCRSPLFSMERRHLHNYNVQMGLMTAKPLGHRLPFCVCVLHTQGARENEPWLGLQLQLLHK